MEFMLIVAFCMVAATIYSLFASRKNIKKRREYLKNRFGKAPEKHASMESVTAYWDQFKAGLKEEPG